MAQVAGSFAYVAFDRSDKFSLIEFEYYIGRNASVNIAAARLTKTGDFGDFKQLSLSLVRWLETLYFADKALHFREPEPLNSSSFAGAGFCHDVQHGCAACCRGEASRGAGKGKREKCQAADERHCTLSCLGES